MPGIGISRHFTFDGGAATYVGTLLLSVLITVVTFGLAYPFALVLQKRWVAKHTFIDGHQLVFTGSAIGLFGNWLKWFLLTIVTLGIYSFWVIPRLQKWVVEHTDFAEQAVAVVAPGQRALAGAPTAAVSGTPPALPHGAAPAMQQPPPPPSL